MVASPLTSSCGIWPTCGSQNEPLRAVLGLPGRVTAEGATTALSVALCGSLRVFRQVHPTGFQTGIVIF